MFEDSLKYIKLIVDSSCIEEIKYLKHNENIEYISEL